MIFFGDIDFFTSDAVRNKSGQRLWLGFRELLEAGGHVYREGLPVMCETHKTRAVLATPEAFDEQAPDGGCRVVCGAKLPCDGRHPCPRRCPSYRAVLPFRQHDECSFSQRLVPTIFASISPQCFLGTHARAFYSRFCVHPVSDSGTTRVRTVFCVYRRVACVWCRA